MNLEGLRPIVRPKGQLLFTKHWPPTIYMQYQSLGKTHRSPKTLKTNAPSNIESSLTAFPSLCKLRDPKVSGSEKFFWCCVVLVISGVCGYQVMQAILLFAGTPVKIEIKIDHLHTIRFPAITVCPDPEEREAALRSLIAIAAFEMGVWDPMGATFNDLNLTINQLATVGSIESRDVNVTTPCLRKMYERSCREPFKTRKEASWTIFGKCLTIIPDDDVQFRGPSTALFVAITQPSVLAFLHQPVNNIRDEAFFMAQPLREKMRLVKTLSAKQFKFKNTGSSPCISPEEASRCKEECITQKLQKNINVNCGMDVYGVNLRDCETIEEAINSQTAIENAYINLTSKDCACTRKCSDVVYTIVTDTSPATDNHSGVEMQMSYPENVQEVVTEEFAYSFAALMSDIGGSLGFYLGFCILQCLETIVDLLKTLESRRRK